MKKKRIAVDFDGTIVTHEFPEIGDWVPGARGWLLRWQNNPDVELILWTMRSDRDGGNNFLERAVKHLEYSGIHFDYINSAPQDWTTSPKVYAHVYIDDAAAGCPLRDVPGCKRKAVDWGVVGPLVERLLHD